MTRIRKMEVSDLSLKIKNEKLQSKLTETEMELEKALVLLHETQDRVVDLILFDDKAARQELIDSIPALKERFEPIQDTNA